MVTKSEIRPAGLKLLTASRMRTFRRCPRLHYLTYDLGWRPMADSEALLFGSLVHEALECWWVEFITGPERAAHWRRIWSRRGVAADVVDTSDAAWDPDPLACALDAIAESKADPYMKAKARATIRAYHRRWATATREYARVVAVECQFVVPLVNPDTGARSRTWMLAGKIDVIIEHLAAKVIAPVEHKTTGKDIGVGTRYWKRLRLDGQLSTYIRGARAVLENDGVDRAWYDVLKRPAERPAKATPTEEREYTKPKYKVCAECKRKTMVTPPPHKLEGTAIECEPDPSGEARRVFCTDRGGKLYANQREADETPDEFEERCFAALDAELPAAMVRDPVTRTDAELDVHAADTWALAELMHRAAADGGRLAVMNVDACDGENGPCHFLDVCFAGASGGEVLWRSGKFRRVDNVHQELPELPEAPLAIGSSDAGAKI